MLSWVKRKRKGYANILSMFKILWSLSHTRGNKGNNSCLLTLLVVLDLDWVQQLFPHIMQGYQDASHTMFFQLQNPWAWKLQAIKWSFRLTRDALQPEFNPFNIRWLSLGASVKNWTSSGFLYYKWWKRENWLLANCATSPNHFLKVSFSYFIIMMPSVNIILTQISWLRREKFSAPLVI